jgi:hypothetical protein
MLVNGRQKFSLKVPWQRFIICLVLIAGLGLTSSPASAWNAGTHVYIANPLGATGGASNWQEMYGAMALDTFNYGSDAQSTYMTDLLHTAAAMQLWNAAKQAGPQYLPVAYGFMTHNNVWGADSTAHNHGLTYGQDIGYVIAKAQLLHTLAPLPSALGIPLDVELYMDHLVVESAVDVLLKQNVDHNLGMEISQAAFNRPTQFPDLLVSAYSDDLLQQFPALTLAEAELFIRSSESQFQLISEAYGQALNTSDPVPLLAGQLAALAEGYIGSLPVSEAQLTAMLTDYINLAMTQCLDFSQEIAATKDFVDQQLQAHNVSYTPLPPSLLLFVFGLAGLGLFKLQS